MNKKTCIGAAALALSLHAHAINKCVDASGVVSYQAAPCPASAKGAVLEIPNAVPGKAPTGEALESRKASCVMWIKNGVEWKDPDSLQIGDVVRIGEGLSFRPNRGAVIRYGTQVNAKNSYGGYSGPKTAICEFDLAEQKIEHVHVNRN